MNGINTSRVIQVNQQVKHELPEEGLFGLLQQAEQSDALDRVQGASEKEGAMEGEMVADEAVRSGDE